MRAAIESGAMPPGSRVPSSRVLSGQLGVARNTVVLALQTLLYEGVLSTRPRSGLYVTDDDAAPAPRLESVGGPSQASPASAWRARFRSDDVERPTFRLPPDWQRYPFPLLTAQFDRSLFPSREWREAQRHTLSTREIDRLSEVSGEADDPMLIEQIRTRILPRRGVTARPEEILVTAGAQQALFLAAELLAGPATRAVVEDPGNPDMRRLLTRRGAKLKLQAVDQEGLVIDEHLRSADLVYVTPSHQRPTAATMSMARRRALLDAARAHDFLIIEDDFECETHYLDRAYPAIAGLQTDGRVIYVASLSRILAPALRLGFMVAPPEVIEAARRLRALVSRHPPINNQRAAGLFLSLGHYDAVMRRLSRVLRLRLLALRDALNHYLPQWVAIPPIREGTTYCVQGPPDLDSAALSKEAAARGVLIEPLDDYFGGANPPRNMFRVGVTSIQKDRIREGVARLAEAVRAVTQDVSAALPADGAGSLRGPALRKAMRGATLLCQTVYADPCTIELHADGTMSGRAGADGEDVDTGRWWVEGNLWCRQWTTWAYGEISRLRVRLTGDRIEWFRPEGGPLVDAGVLARRD
ncbi:MAG: PLP-dependent aminotransferase family protein [Micropepsaceae bacterium]